MARSSGRRGVSEARRRRRHCAEVCVTSETEVVLLVGPGRAGLRRRWRYEARFTTRRGSRHLEVGTRCGAGATAERQGASMLSSSTRKRHMFALVRLTNKTACLLVASLFPFVGLNLVAPVHEYLLAWSWYTIYLPLSKSDHNRFHGHCHQSTTIIEPAHAARQSDANEVQQSQLDESIGWNCYAVGLPVTCI